MKPFGKAKLFTISLLTGKSPSNLLSLSEVPILGGAKVPSVPPPMRALIGDQLFVSSLKGPNYIWPLSRVKYCLVSLKSKGTVFTSIPETNGEYRGSPPYAFFGTWKKSCYMKLVLVGLYYGPLLTLIPPLIRT